MPTEKELEQIAVDYAKKFNVPVEEARRVIDDRMRQPKEVGAGEAAVRAMKIFPNLMGTTANMATQVQSENPIERLGPVIGAASGATGGPAGMAMGGLLGRLMPPKSKADVAAMLAGGLLGGYFGRGAKYGQDVVEGTNVVTKSNFGQNYRRALGTSLGTQAAQNVASRATAGATGEGEALGPPTLNEGLGLVSSMLFPLIPAALQTRIVHGLSPKVRAAVDFLRNKVGEPTLERIDKQAADTAAATSRAAASQVGRSAVPPVLRPAAEAENIERTTINPLTALIDKSKGDVAAFNEMNAAQQTNRLRDVQKLEQERRLAIAENKFKGAVLKSEQLNLNAAEKKFLRTKKDQAVDALGELTDAKTFISTMRARAKAAEAAGLPTVQNMFDPSGPRLSVDRARSLATKLENNLINREEYMGRASLTSQAREARKATYGTTPATTALEEVKTKQAQLNEERLAFEIQHIRDTALAEGKTVSNKQLTAMAREYRATEANNQLRARQAIDAATKQINEIPATPPEVRSFFGQEPINGIIPGVNHNTIADQVLDRGITGDEAHRVVSWLQSNAPEAVEPLKKTILSRLTDRLITGKTPRYADLADSLAPFVGGIKEANRITSVIEAIEKAGESNKLITTAKTAIARGLGWQFASGRFNHAIGAASVTSPTLIADEVMNKIVSNPVFGRQMQQWATDGRLMKETMNSYPVVAAFFHRIGKRVTSEE